MLKKSSGPDVELRRALQKRGAARHEQLIRLSERFSTHAPTWTELAEEHLNGRRKEEALYAAKQALQLDRKIFRRFSPALREACEHFLFEYSGAPANGGAASEPQLRDPNKARKPVYGRIENAKEIGQIAVKIAKAKALKGSDRRRRLEELTREHPNEGRTWLALAEEHIEARRVEESIDAVDRAIALDPALERNMSRKLMNARRYRKAGLEIPGAKNKPARRRAGGAANAGAKAKAYAPRAPEKKDHAAAAGARAKRPSKAPPSQRSRRASNAPPSQRSHRASNAPPPQRSRRASNAPPVALPAQPAPYAAAPQDDDGPRIGHHLAKALELQDKQQRLRALHSLKDVAPRNPAVLFHFAIEAALAGEMEEAQRAGTVLRVVSPERYEKLYALAETYWPADGSAASAEYGDGEDDDEGEDFAWSESMDKTGFFEPPPKKPAREPIRLTEPLPALAQPDPRRARPAPPQLAVEHEPYVAPPPLAQPVPRAAPQPMVQPKPHPAPQPRPHPAPQPLAQPKPYAPPQPLVQPKPHPAPQLPSSSQPAHSLEPAPPPPIVAPPVAMQQPSKASQKKRSPWRTAGALVAGVAAGLLFALLLVIVLSRLNSGKSSFLPQPTNPYPTELESPSTEVTGPAVSFIDPRGQNFG